MLKSIFTPGKIEAGCDEAGRGCLAGPVYAAAVILPENYKHELLNDSKKLSLKQRHILRKHIEKYAISWAVGIIDNKTIDQVNILNASFLAMHQAIQKLTPEPELLLIDGHMFRPYKFIQHKCIIKGDGKYASIAAASILAKTYRDDYMTNIHQDYPHFEWDKNKGYPTAKHKHAIHTYGITQYHRRSFRLMNRQLKIDFTF
jgi:ribonuclease HII